MGTAEGPGPAKSDGPPPKRVASWDLSKNIHIEVPRDQPIPWLPSPRQAIFNPWDSLREARPLVTTTSTVVVAAWAWGLVQIALLAMRRQRY